MMEEETEIKIKNLRTNLVRVMDPIEVTPASTDCDIEIQKLLHNLDILKNIIYICSSEEAKRRSYYYKCKKELFETINEELLMKMSMVKSDKAAYIKASLYDENGSIDQMTAKRNYFKDMNNTYLEMIMAYKKIRGAENA